MVDITSGESARGAGTRKSVVTGASVLQTDEVCCWIAGAVGIDDEHKRLDRAAAARAAAVKSDALELKRAILKTFPTIAT